MQKLTLLEVKRMDDDTLVNTLISNAYDMGVAKVYLEADNYHNDDENLKLLIDELKRRMG